VQLGCCDDSYVMEDIATMTHREFLQSFLSASEPTEKVITELFNLKADGEELKRLTWSGLFSNETIGLTEGSPAKIVEHILNKRWKLQPGDKDFIVMWHRFRYTLQGKTKCVEAYLTATGTDEVQTAMAKTVGLPLGIAAKLLLQNKFRAVGVTIPVTFEFYLPILDELSANGIALQEHEVEN
jgi:saccharopine dehydrogenase-like NADP-dependent oxidoreductase